MMNYINNINQTAVDIRTSEAQPDLGTRQSVLPSPPGRT
jgi:hypothetical protein